jgi:hypothetical protein
MAWMPGASRVQTFSGNRHKRKITKIVLHTTEGSNWPGYGGGGSAPHFTVHRDGTIRQHIDTARSAKALVNRRGGVETNNGGVIQIEFIGSCDRSWARKHGLFFTENATDRDLAGLARVLAWISKTHGVPLTAHGLRWPTSNAAYATAPQRMSYAEWNAYRGVCGHTHVPENDHWDPGNFPVSRLLRLAGGGVSIPIGGGAGVPRPVPADDGLSAGLADVDKAQRSLAALGYDPGPIDGKYGSRTEAATRQAQHDLGITPADGRPGPATRRALGEAVSTLDDIKAIVTQNQVEIRATPDRILDKPIKLAGHDAGKTSSLRTKAAYAAHEHRVTQQQIAALRGELAGAQEALRAVNSGEPLDLEQVRAAARDGVDQALDSLEVTVTKGEG